MSERAVMLMTLAEQEREQTEISADLTHIFAAFSSICS